MGQKITCTKIPYSETSGMSETPTDLTSVSAASYKKKGRLKYGWFYINKNNNKELRCREVNPDLPGESGPCQPLHYIG